MKKLIGACLMMGSLTPGSAAAAEAVGSFTVALTALPAAPGGVAQHRLDKRFSGDLDGGSTGVMMSAGDPAKGIAGYVAMEMVTATLAGRTGGFALQHNGTMDAGGQQLSSTLYVYVAKQSASAIRARREAGILLVSRFGGEC